MSERPLKTIGTKVTADTYDAMLRVQKEYGLSQSIFVKVAVMGLLNQLENGDRTEVIDELTIAILEGHMQLCPVAQSLRAIGKPRDTQASNEEGVKGP